MNIAMIEAATTASKNPENIKADGSVDWDWVSADLHIDNPTWSSDEIDQSINQVADAIS